MLMLHQSRPYFRFLSLLTILTFFPSSIAVWNFVPLRLDVAEAEEAAAPITPAAEVALEEAPQGMPPKILTSDELASLSGGPATGATEQATAPQRTHLPEVEYAWNLPKPTNITPESQSAPAEPIRLAQAGEPNGIEAQLLSADVERDAGNLSGAYLGYVGVLNDYPQAWEQGVIDARDRIKDLAKTFSEAEFRALDPVASDLALLRGPLAIRGTNEFYRAWADACKEREDLDGWVAHTQEVLSRTWWGITQYANDLDVRRLFSWYLTAARELDMKVEGAETLKAFLVQQEPSVITFEGWARLSEKAAAYADNGDRIICAANALASADTLDVVLDNPFELQKEKAELAGRLGQMYEDVGMLDEAIAQYRDLQDRFPVPPERATQGNAVYDAGIRVAQKIASMSPNDVYPGILAYNDFIRRYPNGPLVNQARFEMAGLYTLAGDYRQAANLYRELIQDYPDQAERVWPELDFILTYLYDSVEVASVQPVASPEQTKVAQMCGPSALQKLLKTQGVDVSREELAALAGTDETGTTMLGLVEAARAKGLELAGVEVPEADSLPQPFIAYVNHNHFLVVREVRDDSVVVLDLDKPETALTRAEFARMWDGMALVRADASPQIAKLLNPEVQKGAKGGTEGSGPTTPTVPPDCDDNGCGCGDSGDGNPPGPNKAGSRICNRNGQCRQGQTGGPNCPEAETGVHTPGVNPVLYPSSTTMKLDETDLSIPVRGDNGLAFRRVLVNETGYYRTRFTDNTKPWSNNVGKGWTHAYNMHLVTSTPIAGKPYTVVFYDEQGMERTYNYSSSAGSLHYYYRNSTGSSRERGYTLVLDGSTGKYYLTMPGGREYHFSAATADVYRFARLEKVVDISGNELTLDYNGAVGTGKLTKVSPPAGDSRYLQFSYSGNQITKVELKKSATVLQTVQYAFNANKELTKITDDASHDVVYSYHTFASAPSTRFITKITDKAGRATDFTYTFGYSSGYKATKVDLDNAAGLRTTYDRSIATGVAVATNSKGGAILGKFGYTPVTGDVSRAKSLDYYRYDGAWNDYKRVLYEYDAASKGRTKSSIGGTTVQESSYNSAGRLSGIQCIKAPCGAGTVGGAATGVYYETASSLYPTKRTGPDGLDIRYYYDSKWRVTKVTHPSVAASGYQFAYDAYGQVTTVTDPLGHATTLGCDATGNVTSATDPNSSTTTMYYDDYGNVTRVTNPLNKDTYFYYAYGGCGGCGGGGNQLTKVKDALNNETEMHYDLNGNVTKTIDALDRETDFAYDTMDRLTSVTFPSGSGNTSTMAYDDVGMMTSQTDFGGKTTTYEYDHLGNTTKVTDPVGDVETSYDTLGNVSTVTDGLDHTTTYTYDGNNHLTKITYADGKVIRYLFDTVARMTKVGAGASGTVDPTEYFYNGSTGLMTKVGYTSGGNTSYANYYYDGSARLTKLTDWIDGTDGLRYAYDAGGRLTTLTDYDDSTLDYTYDAAGNVLTMEDYHDSVVTYTYTDTNRVSTITAPGSKVWDYDYNALGQPTSVSIPNGMDTVYGYDVRNRLTKIEHKDGANVLDGYYYVLDDGGDITRTTYQDDQYWDYWYDGRDRLTKAERRNNVDALLHRYTYTYDAGENMTTKEIYDGTETDTYVYAHTVANELTKQSFGGTDTTLGYDAWGRMTSKSDGTYSATYGYGPPGMLSTVTTDFPSEADTTFATGGDGRRRSRTVNSTETWYNWAGFAVINEETSAGILSRTYFGLTAAHVDGTNPGTGSYEYYFHDHLGSTRRLRAQDKSSLGTYEYTPYGNMYAESGDTTIARRYAMLEWNFASQQYFAPLRHYVPGVARWSSRDPLDMVDGPNVYAYTRNNPLSYTDPLGLAVIGGDGIDTSLETGKDLQNMFKDMLDESCGKESLKRITDRKLRRCLKKRCEDDEFTVCMKKGTPGDGRLLGVGLRQDGEDSVDIFWENVVNTGNVMRMGDIILHEMAHTCKTSKKDPGGNPYWWEDGGMGVPKEPW